MTLNTTANSTVKGIIYKSGTSGNNNVLAAYALYGSGKVFAIGDSSPADDGTGDSGDILYDGWIADANGNHERLIMNATIWLATSVTSVDNIAAENSSIMLFPNPFSETATFSIEPSIDLQNLSIHIYDILGKEVSVLSNFNEHNVVFHKDNLKKSVYIYKVLRNNEVLKTARFVVQ